MEGVIILIVVSVLVLILVGLVTVIRAIYHALTGQSASPRRTEDIRCPYCDRWTAKAREFCDWCGRPHLGETAAELADLKALRRQLQRFRDRNALEPEVVATLLARAERYEQQLLHPPVAPPARPAAAPAAATPFAAPTKKPEPEVVRAEVVERVEPVARVVAPVAKPQAAPVAKPQVVAKPPAPPAPPAPPRKSWLETVSEFLEERNIPLAEPIGLLVGALLIVGPSIALMISFREKLEENLYLKFGIFVAACSAFFGIGLYTFHRWKLKAPGFVWLLIATLLVPLVFWGMTSMSGADWDLLTLAIEAAALALFVYLVTAAAQVMVPRGVWFQVLGVVGNAAAVLLVARLSGVAAHGWPLTATGLIPVAIFAGAVAPFLLFRVPRQENLDPAGAIGLFSLVGSATFSLAVALGMLLATGARADGLAITLQYAAPLFALAAVPVFSSGLAVMRGTEKAPTMGAYRTAGTAIALVAMVAMVIALGMAWPRPLGMLVVGTLDAAALVYLAFRHRMPVAHAGAIACTTLVYLLGFHLLTGHLAWEPGEGAGREILAQLLSARSGTALVGLSVVLGLIAEGLVRRDLRSHGLQYAGGAVVVGLLSLIVVTQAAWFGGHEAALDPTLVYGLYGLGCLALAARWLRRELSYLGLGLLVATSLWGLWWQQAGQITPLWAATLACEGLALSLIAIGLNRPSGAWQAVVDAYRLPVLHAAEIAAGLAVCFALGTATMDQGSASLPIAAACVAATCFLMAWGYGSRERTWIGSAVVLLGLLHATVLNYEGTIAWPYTGALLAHATLAVLAVLGIRIAGAMGGLSALAPGSAQGTVGAVSIGQVFLEPLTQSGLLSSAAALALLVNVVGREPSWLAGCLFWVAAIWLLAAWLERWPVLLSAAQVVLSGATVAAVVAWLWENPWDAGTTADLLDPRSFQAYGIGLGLLTLAWLVVRIVAQRSEEAQRLLEPGWLGVDWVVGHGVIVAQFLLLAGCVFSHCLIELGRLTVPSAPWTALAFGPPAWILLGVLALTLLATLWHRWEEVEIAGAIVVGASVSYLVAGGYGPQLLSATSLRWTLGATCLVGAGVVWLRQPLCRACLRIGTRVTAGLRGPATAQAVLLVTTALPVLALTLLAAFFQLAGTSPHAAIGQSLFARLDPNTSYLVPLALVIAALVGFALRETSAGYAFSAGLVVQMTVVLGYLLGLTTRGHAIGVAELTMVVQLATITAAVWAVVWLLARQGVNVWREEPASRSSRVLMDVQLGMGHFGNAVLLAPALVLLILSGPHLQAWTVAAGSVWGWLALALATAAAIYRQVQLKRPLQPAMAGLVGMAALGLLACTVCTLLPEAPQWGYRTLMLGWAAYALLIVLATWWIASLRTLPGAAGPPQILVRAAAGWVIGAGLAAVLLGLKAAFLHELYEDILWGAAAIAIASVAGAAMAVWRREETWAFAAAPGVNLAASLVVWYFQWYWRPDIDFHEWWVLLVLANVIATEAVALVWLAARKRLYELRAFSIRTSPLLGAQVVLGIGALVAVLSPAAANVVVWPNRMPAWIAQMANAPGWIALVLAAAAAGWYLWEASRRDLFHLVGGLGLAVGVLLMSLASRWEDALAHDAWLPYHVLMSTWAAVGLGLLALGWLGRNRRLADPEQSNLGQPMVLPIHVQSWVTTIGTLVLGLALLHVRHDPTGPWWSFGAVLGLSLAAGWLAVWLRLPAYVCVSGLSINVAGTVLWIQWDGESFSTLVQTNIVCLAIASAIWSLVGLLDRRGAPSLSFGNRRESFAHVAVQLGVALLFALAAGYLLCQANGIEYAPLGRLAWTAWGAIVAAVLLCLWDPSARLVLPGLYVLGLAAIGLGLAARDLEPRLLAWTAGPELAAYALATSLAGMLIVRMQPVWQALRIPNSNCGAGVSPALGSRDGCTTNSGSRDGCTTSGGRWPENWFPAAHVGVVGLAAVLGTWVSIDFAFAGVGHPLLSWIAGRVPGASAVALLLAASVATAQLATGRWREGWQHATVGLGVLALSTLGWALLDPTQSLPWLHRSVILMVAAVAVTLAAGFGLERLFAEARDWINAGRRSVPALAGLALVALAAILGQEVFHYTVNVGVPIALWAKLIVVAALAGLVAACIVFAVVPRLDPLGLSDEQRKLYVYAAEALVLLVCFHLRWTMPELFRMGIIKHYWMLLVMGIAFAGAALSELFHRRGMPVLSEPLARTAAFLPFIPAAFYWIVPDAPGVWSLEDASPAVWFLSGLFYGILAVTKRNPWPAAAAILASNIGLWLLWHRLDWGFLQHPQLWLIPIALCVIVAEYLNHDRLTESMSTGIRYVALGTVYISSSAEYLRAIGESIWLPLILILLSLVGLFIGVLMRIRSFLYMGVSFLLLVIVTMINYAYVNLQQTWILWICCILLGAMTIAAVGLYEKHREEVRTALRQFRGWQQ